VKPGFVKTKMIENMKTPGPITGTPEAVANRIFYAVIKQRNVIYVLPIWRLIMLIIRNIPEGVFKKLKL
jgi:short-subunit dehydrogenase